MKLLKFIFLCCSIPILISGCSGIKKTAEITGDTLVFTGKVATVTVKTTGTVLKKTGDVAVAGARYFSGSRTIELEKVGNSYFVNAEINGKYKAKLMLDTGASGVLISQKLADKMNLKLSACGGMRSTLADGSRIPSKSTVLDKLKVGSVSAKKVSANIIEMKKSQNFDGLLGMSFLQNFIFTIDTEKNLLRLKSKT